MADSSPALINLETGEELRSSGAPDGFLQRRGVDYSHGQGQPLSTRSAFFGVRAARFALRMLFESSLPGEPPTDVRPKLKALEAAERRGDRTPSPFLLSWGSFSCPVLVDEVHVQYLRFDPSGFPVRAEATLQLTELRDPDRLTELAGITAKPLASATLLAPVVGVAALAGPVIALAKKGEAEIQRARAKAERVAEEVKSAANEAKREAERTAKRLKQEAEDAVKEVAGEAERLKSEAVRTFDEAKTKVDAKVEELRGKVEVAVNDAKSELDELKGEAIKAKDEAVGVVKTHVERAKKLADESVAALERFEQSVGEEIKEDAEKALVGLKSATQDVKQRIRTAIDGAALEVSGRARDEAQFLRTLRDDLEERATSLRADFERTARDAEARFQQAKQDVERASALGSLREAVKGLVSADELRTSLQQAQKTAASLKAEAEDQVGTLEAALTARAADLSSTMLARARTLQNLPKDVRDRLAAQADGLRRRWVEERAAATRTLEAQSAQLKDAAKGLRDAAEKLEADASTALARLDERAAKLADELEQRVKSERVEAVRAATETKDAVGREFEEAKATSGAAVEDELQKMTSYVDLGSNAVRSRAAALQARFESAGAADRVANEALARVDRCIAALR